MNRILAINGSYRDDGVTDKAVAALLRSVQAAGVEVEHIHLRDYPIEFCLNCRECTQQPGDAPGKCVIDDGMHTLVAKIEQADAYIFASPTNYGSVTAIFKRFMERLTVYGYWPWGTSAPKDRKAKLPRKKAILVSSCAAPGLMGRWLYSSIGQLKMAARVVGAKSVGTIFIGLVSSEPQPQLSQKTLARIDKLAAQLV